MIDTSALAAIVLGEADASAIGRCASTAIEVRLSTAIAVEAFIVLRSRLGQAGVDRLEALISALSIGLEPVDAAQMRVAIDAYGRYGRGSGHPAQLNYGDCFSYALARTLDAPLLFKGDDFRHTDVRSALDSAA